VGFEGVESMNLVSEISNELAIAILVEKRHQEALEVRSAKDFIENISETLVITKSLTASVDLCGASSEEKSE
jgi:hypothetical protein